MAGFPKTRGFRVAGFLRWESLRLLLLSPSVSGDLFSQHQAKPDSGTDLSGEPSLGHKYQPLAARMRPRTLSEYVGQEHILAPGKLLRRAIEADRIQSLIFFGPPGTGKTMMAKAVANSTTASFISVVGSEFVQKYLGEGPRMVRDVFRLARARDRLAVVRGQVLRQLRHPRLARLRRGHQGFPPFPRARRVGIRAPFQ